MSSARSCGWGGLLLVAALEAGVASRPAETPSAYAVVVSQQTAAEPAWKAVREALVAKHQGRVLAWHPGTVAGSLPGVRT